MFKLKPGKDGKLKSPFYQFDLCFCGTRYQGSTKMRNKAAALRFESLYINRLSNKRAGIVEPVMTPIFLFFATKFLDAIQNLRANTLRGYRNSLVILSAFHKKHLDEITATEIEQFKNARLADGKSPSTVNRDLAFFASRWRLRCGRIFCR